MADLPCCVLTAGSDDEPRPSLSDEHVYDGFAPIFVVQAVNQR